MWQCDVPLQENEEIPRKYSPVIGANYFEEVTDRIGAA